MEKKEELKRFALDLARHYYGRVVVKARDEDEAVDKFYADGYSDKLSAKECLTHLEDEIVCVEEADFGVAKDASETPAAKKRFCFEVERRYTGKIFVDADDEEQAYEFLHAYDMFDDIDYKWLEDAVLRVYETERETQ